MYTVTLMSAVDSNADLTTSSTIFEYPQGLNGCKLVCEKGNLSVEVISTANGTTGTVKLQACDSGASGDFADVSDMSVSANSGTVSCSMNFVMKKYYRLVYSKGNNTTGTITATLTFS